MKDKDKKEFINNLAFRYALNLLKTGADPINFKILNLLPTNTKQLQEELNLTKMPINKRLNELEEVGLLKRQRYKGKLDKTSLTSKFFNAYNKIHTTILNNSELQFVPKFNLTLK